MAAVDDLSAKIVGDAFAMQYYQILQQTPELVHRFYNDMSKVSRYNSDGRLMWSTTTKEAINEKMKSCGGLKADVKSVDAQESFNEGIIVVVNGSMVNEDDSRRNFTQTFFLAPQEKGYYVLNDIFRYANNDNPDSNNEQDGGMSPDQEPPPIEENHISEKSNGELYNLSGELPVEAVKEEFHIEEEFEEKEGVPEVVEETVEDSWMEVESNAKVEDTSKRSYTSIVSDWFKW